MKKIPIIEAGLSIVSVWWAFVMFTHSDLFKDVPTQLSFFAKIAQEVGWGIFFLVAAFIKMIGLVTEKKILRVIGLYMSTFVYSLISAGYLLSSDPIKPGTGIHFVLMIFALWALREVKNNAKPNP